MYAASDRRRGRDRRTDIPGVAVLRQLPMVDGHHATSRSMPSEPAGRGVASDRKRDRRLPAHGGRHVVRGAPRAEPAITETPRGQRARPLCIPPVFRIVWNPPWNIEAVRRSVTQFWRFPCSHRITWIDCHRVSGSCRCWGTRGRQFKSGHADHSLCPANGHFPLLRTRYDGVLADEAASPYVRRQARSRHRGQPGGRTAWAAGRQTLERASVR
jgi:hypothetical protein